MRGPEDGPTDQKVLILPPSILEKKGTEDGTDDP